MAAGCKPAAPWSYGGSNPPLCTRIWWSVSKFAVAMAIFALLELLSWQTLSDPKIRVVAMVIVAMFAVRTWVHHRREMLESTGNKAEHGQE
jgi:hypothetical protein